MTRRGVWWATHAIARRIRAVQRRVTEGAGAYALLYHRIARVSVDPWGLAVSPEHFADQMSVLRRRAHPIRFRDLVRGQSSASLPRNAVAVTFDDGYADNLYEALPILARYEVPATVFLATGYLGRAYWWDEVHHLILGEHPLPREFVLEGRRADGTLSVFRRALDATIYSPRDPRGDHGWRADDGARDGRQALFLDLWAWCADLTPDSRHAAIATLDACVGPVPRATAPRAMTASEVRAITASGLVEVGAHTVTHPMLSRLNAASQRAEVVDSRDAIAAILGAPPVSFSYPHGRWSADVLSIVRECGFTAIGTSGNADYGTNGHFDCRSPSEDPHHVPRATVPDVSGQALWRQFVGGFR